MSGRRRSVGGLLAAFAVVAMLAACEHGPAYGPPPTDVAALVIANTNLKFEPSQIAVHVGDTVEWRNQSPFSHSVTDDPAWAHGEGDAILPPGAAPFNSGLIPKGEVFRHAFTVPGTYRYFSIPFENFGMTGTVTVLP